jgi:hypothetical protein
VGKADYSVAGKDAFAVVIKDGQNAIDKLVEMLKKGDADEAKNAGGKVKKSYKAVFFLPECS